MTPDRLLHLMSAPWLSPAELAELIAYLREMERKQ